ncbi:PREDICTED: intestinal mucin-like protein, partial [Galeopterus variegatus]|uniref:Intestinal mucin-like protein n=1 Tax=Galeopterus variegatus TaxID=482537 RepID=A0ABM0SDN9_GALVR
PTATPTHPPITIPTTSPTSTPTPSPATTSTTSPTSTPMPSPVTTSTTSPTDHLYHLTNVHAHAFTSDHLYHLTNGHAHASTNNHPYNLTNVHAHAFTSDHLYHLTNDHPHAPTNNHLYNVTNVHIHAFTSDHVYHLTNGHAHASTNNHPYNLTNVHAHAFTSDHLSHLTNDHPHAPTNNHLYNVTNVHVHAFTSDHVYHLTNGHAHASTNNHPYNLPNVHAHAFTIDHVYHLTNDHPHAPTNNHLYNLTNVHAHAFTSDQLYHLSNGNAHSSTNDHVCHLTNGHLYHLSNSHAYSYTNTHYRPHRSDLHSASSHLLLAVEFASKLCTAWSTSSPMGLLVTLAMYCTTTSSKTPPSSGTTPTMPETTSTSASRVPTPTLSPLVSPSISMSTGQRLTTVSLVICCVLNDTYYGPGELVYNGTFGDTCYYVNCSVNCTFEFHNSSCPSTPSPTPSAPTPSSPSTPTHISPATTKPPACPDFDPPRQENETWSLCDCIIATCKHNNTVEIEEVKCEPPPMPTCSNDLKPVQVMDPDGCCWHWECDCYCTGWGDPHFVTFDGLYYSYQGNCTYVLVEEVTPTVDNFGVYIDNYHCDVNDKVSCPRTIIVRHETQEVLIKTMHMTPMEVQVQVNSQTVALPYEKYGLQVYESGINYVVDIPELGALISYNGLSFSIRLPYHLFGNNTKGQCGTCTNTTVDDCMLPSGEVISNCEVAADQWVVNDPSKPHCTYNSFTTQRPVPTKPGSNKTCTESLLCQLIKDSLFAQCHALVPPQRYYDACVFDSCFVPDSGMECASLQTYAALCAQQGICIDWRKHTQGTCSVTCPSHREYKACGPAQESTCKSTSSQQNSTGLVEGCFCPEGTMNYAPGFDVCVKTCGCVGPDNVPREFGESFEFDCKDCTCLEGGSGIVCQTKNCDQKSLTQCEEDGTYLATEVNPANPCCNITLCKCNTSLCKAEPPVCPLGFQVKSKMVSGRCCPFYWCEPKGVCVHENAEYQPGSPVYSSKCQDCVCTSAVNSSTMLSVITCTHVSCNTSCSPGFELMEVPGECCKKCVQTHCIISRPGSEPTVLKPGDVQSDPTNNCTFFSCVKIHNQLISSVSNISCPDFDPSTCLPGSITFMSNGCCRTCTPRNQTRVPCSTIPVIREISHAGCTKNVTMNYCSGSCGTFAMYSAEAQSLDHRCSCCKEETTSQREVFLSCPHGGLLNYTYTHIESCLCQDTVCEPQWTNEDTSVRARRSSPRRLGRE